MNTSVRPAKRQPMKGRMRLVPPRIPFSPSLDTISTLKGLPMAVPPAKPTLVPHRPPTGPKLHREKSKGDNDIVVTPGKEASLMRELSSLRGKVSTVSLTSLPAAPPSPTPHLEQRPQLQSHSYDPDLCDKSSLVLSLWRKFTSTDSGSRGSHNGRLLPNGGRGWGSRRRASQENRVEHTYFSALSIL